MDKLRADGELDNTLVVLTADHGSVPGRDFLGTQNPELNYGYYNWYYGEAANDDPYLKPQDALKPLTGTNNVGLSYSDSMLRAWLQDTSNAKVSEAASIMAGMPGVSAVWTRAGDRYTRVSPVRYDRMTNPGEKAWFVQHAQELVDTEAAAYGPEVIATLVDDTTYSVAGDHGGIQRRSQQIPIVFAGAADCVRLLRSGCARAAHRAARHRRGPSRPRRPGRHHVGGAAAEPGCAAP
jgi:arylsulfatase A-like enzyme